MNYLHIIYLVATSTIIVACSAGTQNPAEGSGSGESAAVAVPMHEKLVRNAVAQQLEVSVDEIEIVNSVRTEFSDSSLGCPQPGMMYAQVITEGYRTTARYNDQKFDVRSAGTYVKICGQPNIKMP